MLIGLALIVLSGLGGWWYRRWQRRRADRARGEFVIQRLRYLLKENH